MKSIYALASLSAFFSTVLGHGHMTKITIDGKDYAGPAIGQQTDSVIRMITDLGPVKDLTSDDMSCGTGAAKLTATQVATAKPGSVIGVSWISGDPSTPWPHNVGPLTTYIADCGGDCTKFASLNAKWIKIDEAGKVNGTTANDWVQGETLHVGQSYSFTLPKSTPSGNYLMRHEILALHNAQAQGGAEVYPACSQITVSGSSGTINVPSSEIASFPGAYKATDPGILIDVYTPSTAAYQFPGPDVVMDLTTGATGSASGSSTSSGSGSGSSSSGSGSGSGSASNSTSSSGAGSNDDNQDCDDDGSDGNDDDSTVTVTEYVTVTASVPSQHRHTATAMVTVTVSPGAGGNAAAAVVTSSPVAAPTITSSVQAGAGSGEYKPKKRSRIMPRHYSGTH